MLQAIELWVMLSGVGLFGMGWACGRLWQEATMREEGQ